VVNVGSFEVSPAQQLFFTCPTRDREEKSRSGGDLREGGREWHTTKYPLGKHLRELETDCNLQLGEPVARGVQRSGRCRSCCWGGKRW